MDIGARYNGYCSDMTRTVAYGQVGSKQAEIYNHVLKAQKLALDGIKSGIKGKDGDKIARDYFDENGFWRSTTPMLTKSTPEAPGTIWLR